MPSSQPTVRLQDILENVLLIKSYLIGMDMQTFASDKRTRDAVERCLERICEAAAKLGSAAEELAPGPPWQAVRSLGNVLRHAYDSIDPSRIWEIATRDLPVMEAAVRVALDKRADETK